MLRSAICVIHQKSRETDDSPHIWDDLVKQGHCIDEYRVAQLMCQDSIRAQPVKKWLAIIPPVPALFPVATNTLDQAFTAEAPNRV